MQVGHKLQIHCQECEAPIFFSVLDQDHFTKILLCNQCGQKYAFEDTTLLKHLHQFESLCHQIHASQDILGEASIAIDVGSHHVKVPFNILLTRLSSVIDLEVKGKKISVAFRIEPLKDVPDAFN
ncbi:MAG: hypothetical protein R3E91_05580 [Chlamydiales bacterium]